MGQTLSEPITEKETTLGEDSRMLFGASCMQGWRITMEDAHTSILRLNSRFNTTDLKKLEEELNKEPPKDELHYSFFAVFDGHGGSSVAKYSGEHLHWRLLEEEAFKQKDFKKALKSAYLNMDKEMLNEPSIIRNPAGCTAVSALITDDNMLYIANSGDSRAIISVDGVSNDITEDHKPTKPGIFINNNSSNSSNCCCCDSSNNNSSSSSNRIIFFNTYGPFHIVVTVVVAIVVIIIVVVVVIVVAVVVAIVVIELFFLIHMVLFI
ncbi:hypothetical protein BCR36DRAFT_67072 [Piromyces finnis]|uniref:PPM-type phosphatase domain-containing protein n=1 Tax=Piromyces finnis TaxID=1754191 RepID=A0A1Y1V7U3_9FUNG|nr:hypothetical protein BCR36DRAFT_67072 [Piromyces finnis]|eukprot:ORX49260.1 hypothetical protein BCR36DRAFT_67072 [Piromyces finnis]